MTEKKQHITIAERQANYDKAHPEEVARDEARRERSKDWLMKSFSAAAKWTSHEAAELMHQGAKATAAHLTKAAADFKAGKRDAGVAQMQAAAMNAQSEGKPAEATKIENHIEVVMKEGQQPEVKQTRPVPPPPPEYRPE